MGVMYYHCGYKEAKITTYEQSRKFMPKRNLPSKLYFDLTWDILREVFIDNLIYFEREVKLAISA